jgi:hypothetical protein
MFVWKFRIHKHVQQQETEGMEVVLSAAYCPKPRQNQQSLIQKGI